MNEFFRLLTRDLRLSNLRESFFFCLANHLPRSYTVDALRALILKLAGMNIHYPAHIWAPLEIRPIGTAKRISIGQDTFINSQVRLTVRSPATVTIGKRVMIGPDCLFETVNQAKVPLVNAREVPNLPRSVLGTVPGRERESPFCRGSTSERKVSSLQVR